MRGKMLWKRQLLLEVDIMKQIYPSYYGEQPDPNIEYKIDEFPLVKKLLPYLIK